MKVLVVDVGNTSTAVGVWHDGRVCEVNHIDCGVDETLRLAQGIIGKFGIDKVAYASVVPARDSEFRACFKRLKVNFHQVGWTDSPLKLDYPKPETIGADRIADAAAAVDRYGAPVLVMDFGTALTAAVVTKDLVWRGGVIAPGFPLMRDYMFERTAKLPRIELKSAKVPKIGRSTEEAMRFGAIVGYRGMVKEIVARLSANFKTDFKLVATGGYSKIVLNRIGLPFKIDPTLTLHGVGVLCARHFS